MTIVKDVPLPGIRPIPLRLNGPRGIVKAFLLTHRDTVLVDTGFSDGDADLIAAALARVGRRVKDIDLCILTHDHADHVGGLRRLHDEAPFPVAAHRLDAESIEHRAGVAIERRLDGGEELPLCGGLRVLHLPGHSPGSLALYHPATRTLLAGDTVFSAGEWLIPPPPYLCADAPQAVQSLRELVALELDVENVLVAHGEDVCGGGAESLRLALETRRPF